MKNVETELHDQGWRHEIFVAMYALLLLFGLWFLSALDRLPTTVSVLDFIVMILAVFRITRLFVYDQALDFVRDAARNVHTIEQGGYAVDKKWRPRRGFKRSFFDLLNCPWCVGMWVTLLVAFLYFLTPVAWLVIFVFALAGAGTLLHIFSEIAVEKSTQNKIRTKTMHHKLDEDCSCDRRRV